MAVPRSVARISDADRAVVSPNAAGSVTAPRFNAIEGVRGVLSVIVVIGHVNANFALWFWGCMEVFFAISGYLIGTIAIRHRAAPDFWRVYLMRRALRIWPLYFTVLAFCVAADLVHAGPFGAAGAGLGWGTLRSLFFLQNTEFYFTPYPVPRLAGGGYPSMFNHSWSVAMEEQFYLLAPGLTWLVAAGITRLGSSLWRQLVLVILFLAACILIRACGLSWWVLIGRMDAFVLGIVLAALLSCEGFRESLGRSLWTKVWLAAITLVTAAFMLAYYYPTRYAYGSNSPYEWRHLFGVSVFALFGASLVACCVTGLLPRLLSPLQWRLFQFLGRISYSTYLWHVPILLLLQRTTWYTTDIPHGLHGLLLIIIVISVGGLSYRWIELPPMTHKPVFASINLRSRLDVVEPVR